MVETEALVLELLLIVSVVAILVRCFRFLYAVAQCRREPLTRLTAGSRRSRA